MAQLKRVELEDSLVNMGKESWVVAEALNEFDELTEEGVDEVDAFALVMDCYE